MGGQGRPPSPLQESKQAKISYYIRVKSPKAESARTRKHPEPGTSSQETPENEESNTNRGPTAPFWETRGRSQYLPTAETLAENQTSISRVGGAVVWGRPTRKRPQEMEKDQETLALGKQTPSRRGRKKGSTNRTSKTKEVGGNQAGKVKDIRKYFEEKAGSSAPSQEIGRKEASRPDSKEPDPEPKTGNGEFKGKEPTEIE